MIGEASALSATTAQHIKVVSCRVRRFVYPGITLIRRFCEFSTVSTIHIPFDSEPHEHSRANHVPKSHPVPSRGVNLYTLSHAARNMHSDAEM